ncbi:MAG TPA: serine hydrolase [Phnomibacter sp.]|nr:serine hydrolase [Phnomibacter sp.]
MYRTPCTISFIFCLAMALLACKAKPPQALVAETPPAPVSEIFLPDSFPANSPLLTGLLQKMPANFQPIVQNPATYRLQIIYTQIDRDSLNRPLFRHHFFNAGDAYTYPASTVKFPAAVLALEKLNRLALDGADVGLNTSMFTGALRPGEKPVYDDPTSRSGKPSVGHYIKKILLVSDNDAFNRLYEFLGQRPFNERLHQLGFGRAQIVHRLETALSEEEHRTTNPIWFADAQGNTLYRQPYAKSDMVYAGRDDKLGRGYKTGSGPGKPATLVNGPLDFSRKNRWPISYAHLLTQWVLFPEAQPDSNRLLLSRTDYEFLWRYMSMLPGESDRPPYDTAAYWPAYVKFLLAGSEKGPWPWPQLRMFNKVGDAYGHLLDAAYIVDFEHKVEFLLSAVVYCNSNGILNDDRYDYDDVGLPFLGALGKTIYAYELQRERPRAPDLSRFVIPYNEQP